MNFFFFHIGDYASATRHLSWEEDLAYRRLMDVYYSRETPLPADKKAVYRLVMAENAKQRQAVDAVLSEFFTLSPEGFRNARCEREIAKCRKAKAENWWSTLTKSQRCAMQAARRAAKISATPKWLTVEHREAIRGVYAECQRISAESGVPHQVDHVIPLRSEIVCGLHVPWNLRVLPAEENRRKGNGVLQ